jgi:hypothetical protein
MRLFGAFFFVGILALACGGIYNLGFNQGYTQAVLASGAEAAALPALVPFLPGWAGSPGPFLALGGIFFLGFLLLLVLGIIFGRRYWSSPDHWKYHGERYPYRGYWGGPPQSEGESPSEKRRSGEEAGPVV